MRIAVALTAVLLAVSGCSDDPAPSSLPPLPSPTAASAASPLPVPEAAKAETPQGASAFARYFFDVANRAFAESNSDLLRAVSDAGCGGCQNLIGAIDKPLPDGQRVEGGDFEVLAAESPALADGESLLFVRYRVTALRVLDRQGKVLRTKPATEPINADLRIQRRDGSWVVLGFRNQGAS